MVLLLLGDNVYSLAAVTMSCNWVISDSQLINFDKVGAVCPVC